MDVKENSLRFLEFCCKLAVYPTKQGIYVLQATEDKSGGRIGLTGDQLYDAFENNKLDELLKSGSVETKTMDIGERFPPINKPI